MLTKMRQELIKEAGNWKHTRTNQQNISHEQAQTIWTKKYGGTGSWDRTPGELDWKRNSTRKKGKNKRIIFCTEPKNVAWNTKQTKAKNKNNKKREETIWGVGVNINIKQKVDATARGLANGKRNINDKVFSTPPRFFYPSRRSCSLQSCKFYGDICAEYGALAMLCLHESPQNPTPQNQKLNSSGGPGWKLWPTKQSRAKCRKSVKGNICKSQPQSL